MGFISRQPLLRNESTEIRNALKRDKCPYQSHLLFHHNYTHMVL